MKHVLALGDLRHAHFLITDGADVVVCVNLLLRGVPETVDLAHCCPSLYKSRPAVLCLTPDVEISVDEHHAGSDSTTALKYQNPASVKEEKDSKEELDQVAESPDIVNPVVQTLPQPVLTVGVPHEEAVDEECDEDLNDDLHTEGGHGEYPGADVEVLPECCDEDRGCHYQE